jgi:GxxExxY protein
MKYELEKRGLRVLSREPIPLVWETVRMELAFEADLIVEDVVVVELKSVEQLARVHGKKLLTYLRLMNCRLGLLINFGEELIGDGISRVVNGSLMQKMTATPSCCAAATCRSSDASAIAQHGAETVRELSRDPRREKSRGHRVGCCYSVRWP